MTALDFVESYLRTIFGFIGITDIRFFSVQPMDVSAELRREALKTAVSDVREWVRSGAWDLRPDDNAPDIPPGAKPQVIVEELGL